MNGEEVFAEPLSRLRPFMERLYRTGCPREFVLVQGFQYAHELAMQRDGRSIRLQELAAEWLELAAKAVGIHDKQVEAIRFAHS